MLPLWCWSSSIQKDKFDPLWSTRLTEKEATKEEATEELVKSISQLLKSQQNPQNTQVFVTWKINFVVQVTNKISYKEHIFNIKDTAISNESRLKVISYQTEINNWTSYMISSVQQMAKNLKMRWNLNVTIFIKQMQQKHRRVSNFRSTSWRGLTIWLQYQYLNLNQI